MNEITVYDNISNQAGIDALGLAICESGMFGAQSKAQGKIIGLQCLCERKPPLEMVKKYHIIDGKLSMRADAMLAEFRKAGGKWIWSDLKNTEVQSASVSFEGVDYQVSYSIEDAKRAEVYKAKTKSGSAGMWVKFPGNMMRARLVSETLRAIAPEIVQGAYTPEEIDAIEPAIEHAKKPIKQAQAVEPEPVAMLQHEEVVQLESSPTPYEPAELEEKTVQMMDNHCDRAESYMIRKGIISAGQSWRDAPAEFLRKVDRQPDKFLATITGGAV